MPNPNCVIVVDDDPSARRGLARLLRPHAKTLWGKMGEMVDARRRFPDLAHQSLCLYCDVDASHGVVSRCQRCPVEPKIYLCSKCSSVAKWSEPSDQQFRVFEAVC